jgi:tyrosyl-tRNA synthetase
VSGVQVPAPPFLETQINTDMKKRIDTDILEIIKRGTVDVIPEEELLEKLKQKRPLRVKLGIDASRPDIHIGIAVILWKLREFQDLGHTAVLIVGDFTGRIGDPSGKSKTRPQLTDEEIKRNVTTYREQVFKILREDRTEFRYNSEWSDKLSVRDMIRLCSKTTVARILERDDFTNRYKQGVPIALHEMLYPIFQAYDSVSIKADVELGGTDQKFNLLQGRELQREFGMEPQMIITMPLLEGLDGINKMSKSYDNYVGITESPREMFGKLMSIPDTLILKYLTLTTRLPESEISEIEMRLNTLGTNPRDIKERLAHEVVKLYHSERDAKFARDEFRKVFREKGIPGEIPTYELKGKSIWIVKLLVDSELAPSRSEARRLVSQGGVKINGEMIRDIDFEIAAENELIIKVGKRKFLRVVP